MNNEIKLVKLDLPVAEAVILVTHLTEFLKGSQGRIQRLTSRKFDLIETILNAKFGFKYTATSGFQKLRPYFTENHWRLIKDITEMDYKIKKMEFSNFYLDQVNKNIHELINVDSYPPYESFQSYDDLKWKQLSEKFIVFEAIKTEEELKKIITELCEKSEQK